MDREEKRLYDKEYRERNKARRRAVWEKWYKENKERVAARYKIWVGRNREIRRVSSREYWRRLKIEVLTHYGQGKLACVICGFSDERALTLDHIIPRRYHSGQERYTGQNLYIWVRKEGYPEGYQTLCMNCQWIKRRENKEYGRQ